MQGAIKDFLLASQNKGLYLPELTRLIIRNIP
jgi:hypothetical protein